jgi:hypothetical protein
MPTQIYQYLITIRFKINVTPGGHFRELSLVTATERLTDMMLGRVADLEQPDSVEAVD